MCYRCAQSVAELMSNMGARRNSWPGESSLNETGGYMTHYNKLAIDRPEVLLFGMAPKPGQTRMGLKIGRGLVYPELNFTLPALEIKKENWPEIRNHDEQIISSALLRAAELECPGVVIEFEALPPMTEHPEWGLEIATILLEGMEKERSAHGLKSVLRMTPNDNREFVRPPQLRSGYHLERMLQLFENSAAAGAHLSLMGNLAAAACDTWSNESVQNIRLLSVMAPTISMEQLIYDCRLMNQALGEGKTAALTLQRWMIASDASLDPQAFILTPENSIALAKAIVGADSRYHAAKAVVLEAVRLMKEAHKAGKLKIAPRELSWLDRVAMAVSDLPEDENEFISDRMEVVDASKYHPEEYGLKA